jgi:predicted HTH domain antitoxin
MPLTISDQDLAAMQMDERQARIEIACRLFEAGRMSFGHAASLAQVSQEEMSEEIERRGIPRYRYTATHLEQDLEGLKLIRGKLAAKE